MGDLSRPLVLLLVGYFPRITSVMWGTRHRTVVRELDLRWQDVSPLVSPAQEFTNKILGILKLLRLSFRIKTLERTILLRPGPGEGWWGWERRRKVDFGTTSVRVGYRLEGLPYRSDFRDRRGRSGQG